MFNLLDIECSNRELLEQAFTHPSYTQDTQSKSIEHYERLEFLGDAVLKLVVSKLLYEKYPNEEEGNLSKIRSIIVSDAQLSTIALQIGIPEKLKLGYSEESTGGRKRPSNIACAFEAMLGAYYLDGKFKEIESFLNENLLSKSEEVFKHFAKYNAKAVLQEYTQKINNVTPEYTTISITGPQHKPVFEVSVTYNNEELATAKGHTKKEAQQNCAYMACVKLGIVKEGDEND